MNIFVMEYNVRRHYETKHPTYTTYAGTKRWQMAASLLAQQQYFVRANKTQENATLASYEVEQLIAQHGKAVLDDFIKQCFTKVTGMMFFWENAGIQQC